MKIKNAILYISIALLPMGVTAKKLPNANGIDVSVQKKHSPVVDEAVQIFKRDLMSASALTSRGYKNVELYQLDMASNKDMKQLGSERVPVLDFITKRDAYWLGKRGGKMIVVGSNGRGVAYGLMQLSQMTEPVGAVFETTQTPSVEFRGLSVEGQRLSNADYHRLFQLMLKMRANTLCTGLDNEDYRLHLTKDLRAMADSFGIDLATPHDDALRLHGHKKDGQTIAITWHDDGYGYMRQADDDNDGGAVYHLSYDGKPYKYQWLATTQPGLIANEMLMAYQNGANRLWMVALHDLNVAAYPLSLFMDLAWSVDTLNTEGVQGHLKQWLVAKYGNQAGEELLKPMQQYYRLAGICRPEFMEKSGFNAEEFGNELERYLNDYRDVANKMRAAEKSIDESRKDAYYLNLEYPVIASGLMADKTLQAQESRLIGRVQSFHIDDEALESAARSMKAYLALQSLTDQYNEIAAKQIWNKTIDEKQKALSKPQLTDTVSVAEVEKYYNGEPVYAPLTDDGCIVRNAYQYSSASDNARQIDLLGHSLRAVELQKDGELTYNFSSETVGGVLRLAFVPAYSPDGGSSQCSVSIDGGTPTTVIINDGSASSKRWQEGVLRGQSLITLPVSLSSGSHTLTVKALNDHVIFDQWMIDRDADRQFYVFPVR